MAGLAALATKASGAKFALTDYNQIKTTLDWLTVAGADLASAATINPTAEFHGVTGTTTIDTITLASLTVAAGQQVRLWIKGGPLTIRNNGGGTGNIRTLSGSDIALPTGVVVAFVYDGTVWRQVRDTPQQIAKATATADVTITATTEGTAQQLVALPSTNYDGGEIALELDCQVDTLGNNINIIVVALRDSTVLGNWKIAGSGAYEYNPLRPRWYDTPAAGAHTYTAKAYVSVSSCTFRAGTGGTGAYLPMRLTAWKVA